MPLFTSRPQIFRNKDLLEADHLPDTFEARQTELNTYQDALYPVYNGEKPKNIFINGDAGSGKTSVTRYLLNHLEEDAQANDVDVSHVYVNCDSLKNSYQLARALTNALREQRPENTDVVPKKGFSKPDMFEFLFEELEKTTGTTLLVLDELNNIEDHDLLYQLPRAHSNQRLSDTTRVPGIIGISNDVNYLDTLPPNVEDTLNQEHIRFNPYKATELENILNSRALDALYDDVLDDDVIPLCAAMAANENGSARRALRLLRTAGELTRDDEEDTVTTDYVRLAEEKLDRDLVKETINAGTSQTQLALLTVALAASKQDTYERTSNLHDTYETISTNSGHTLLKHDRFRQRLDTLTEQSIIKCQTKNDDGQYSQYDLHKDLVVILDALSDEPELHDTIKTCVKHARKNRVLTKDDLDDISL